ncbi:winged helix-turn-helix domain-containing protein [Kitasatospora purpeofusca]|uniref:winged helix-turn-helix domain-containing protein n=1 Tax=Kitasatospora purpeofusca TaxID=67352 RepID=UPI0038671AC8|nr:winged helix-turn-helix domain-containing protein [Kitasatospora purpeofusca]
MLGTTRARTLRAAADPAGTAELARRTGTPPATASHHTTVLRSAGLLTTERTGPGVGHTLTPLGKALLDDRTPDRPQPTRRDRPEERTPGRDDHRRQAEPGVRGPCTPARPSHLLHPGVARAGPAREVPCPARIVSSASQPT